jgi:hypothetical protein
MFMRLEHVSQFNGDSDLIEPWLKYYLQPGVERSHSVVHDRLEENSRLLAIKDLCPISTEDTWGLLSH